MANPLPARRHLNLAADSSQAGAHSFHTACWADQVNGVVRLAKGHTCILHGSTHGPSCGRYDLPRAGVDDVGVAHGVGESKRNSLDRAPSQRAFTQRPRKASFDVVSQLVHVGLDGAIGEQAQAARLPQPALAVFHGAISTGRPNNRREHLRKASEVGRVTSRCAAPLQPPLQQVIHDVPGDGCRLHRNANMVVAALADEGCGCGSSDSLKVANDNRPNPDFYVTRQPVATQLLHAFLQVYFAGSV